MRILHWFRKDLRLDDNTALSEAARDAAGEVVPFYMSEPAILGRDDLSPARVRFVLDALVALAGDIRAEGSTLALAHGDAVELVRKVALAVGADAVYWNDEYEPALLARDDQVERVLGAAGIRVRRFHDRLLVPPGGVHTLAGQAYTVFTPFRRACEARPVSTPHPRASRFAAHAWIERTLASLAQLGLSEPASLPWPAGEHAARERLERWLGDRRQGAGLAHYATHRDMPAAPASSRLSADLRFGTIGIRRLVQAVRAAAAANPAHQEAAEKYVSELRWRDFYSHVLFHFPYVERGCFRRAFDALGWAGRPEWFVAWREGRTGFPIVDAGMHELLATGFVHNRVRMIVASFLTKDLLTDWREGERHFMRHLVDGDLASNNGGWQWAAGTGTDAAPYFRIFHPVAQGERFDADGAYVRRWVPELARVPAAFVHRPWEAPPLVLAEAGVTLGENYPFSIVQHAVQRERALAMYGAVRRATA